MEYVFIGPVLLPITPAKIEEKIPGGNETVRLINDGEINIRHSPGLKSYTFDVILPTSYSYPFQNYKMAGMEAIVFKTYFKTLFERKMPFPFIQVTWNNNIAASVVGLLNIAFSNTLCTIEDMTDLRDAENGQDKIISLSLKEYKNYGTKLATEAGKDRNGNITYKVTQPSGRAEMAELGKLVGDVVNEFKNTGLAVVNEASLLWNGSWEEIGKTYVDRGKSFLGW